MSLIEAKHITKDYQAGEVTVRALKGVSFEIEPTSMCPSWVPRGAGRPLS